MRSILVDGGNDPEFATRMDTARAFARALAGHVTVLVDTPVAAYVSTDPMAGSQLAVEALNQALDRDDARAVELQEALADQDVAGTVKRSEGEPIEALQDAARLADLVVLSRSGLLTRRLAASLRIPALVLPDGGTLALPLRSACVAWDGSEGAAAALRAAPALLAGCGRVSVITVQEEGASVSPDDATDYLRVHGIPAEAVVLDREGSVAQTLAAAIAERGTALLVMGASGHGLIRELLFGGVASHFLEAADQPALLLAH